MRYLLITLIWSSFSLCMEDPSPAKLSKEPVNATSSFTKPDISDYDDEELGKIKYFKNREIGDLFKKNDQDSWKKLAQALKVLSAENHTKIFADDLTPLGFICKYNNWLDLAEEEIKKIISKDTLDTKAYPPINTLIEEDWYDDNWKEPLLCIAARNDTNLVKLLLSSGADPNVMDRMCYTPIDFAIIKNHPDAVIQLLKFGANPNTRLGDKSTPLHRAAKARPDIVKHLLNHGALLVMDSQLKTPLDIAKTNNCSPQILKQLQVALITQDKPGEWSKRLNAWRKIRAQTVIRQLLQKRSLAKA